MFSSRLLATLCLWHSTSGKGSHDRDVLSLRTGQRVERAESRRKHCPPRHPGAVRLRLCGAGPDWQILYDILCQRGELPSNPDLKKLTIDTGRRPLPSWQQECFCFLASLQRGANWWESSGHRTPSPSSHIQELRSKPEGEASIVHPPSQYRDLDSSIISSHPRHHPQQHNSLPLAIAAESSTSSPLMKGI